MSASDQTDPTGDIAVACTLNESEMRDQLDAWARLAPSCLRVEVRPGRSRLWFSADVEPELRAVAAREAACCQFLELSVLLDGELVRLEIGSGTADAQPVIDGLVALASSRAGS